MKTWIRRLRGALSLGFLGSLVGAALGTAWGLVSMLVAGVPIILGVVLFYTLLGTTVGAAAGLGFSALVGTLGARSSLQGLSIWKVGVWGGLAGAVAACLGVVSATGSLLPFLLEGLPFIVASSGIGAALGSGIIRLARAGASGEVGPGSGQRSRIGGGKRQDVG